MLLILCENTGINIVCNSAVTFFGLTKNSQNGSERCSRIDVKKELHSSQGNMLLEINLPIEQGKFVSIYGKSGAGKTTLFKNACRACCPGTRSNKRYRRSMVLIRQTN